MSALLVAPLKNAVQKTLAAQLLNTAGVGDPITFDDVDGIPNLPGVLVINRVDSSGAATASKREYIEYSGTSGNTVLITTRNVDNSNAALTHAVGSIVEFIPDVSWANRMYTALSNVIDVDDLSVDTTKVVTPASVTSSSIALSGTNFLSASGATISAILDEDTMDSNRADAIPTQQSVKAYVDNNPYGGWLTSGLSGVTVTRQSTDNPTVVLRFDADVTNYIWKGMRIKATENSIVHYFIVSADPVYSAPNTDVTCLSEIDTTTPTQAKNLIGATTISDVAYAPPKTYPKGFPISPISWTLKSISVAQLTQNTPTQNTWYDLLNIVVHIGDWQLGYKANLQATVSSGNTAVSIFSTLSDTDSSESDAEFTYRSLGGEITLSLSISYTPATVYRPVTISSKTTKYMNVKTSQSGIGSIAIRGDEGTTVLEATSTLI